MRFLIPLSLLLTGCSALQATPKPPPAPSSQSQEISRAQSGGLTKIGTISVSVQGSPDDAQREVKARADRAGAVYYQILMVSETAMPGFWYATANLYGAAPQR